MARENETWLPSQVQLHHDGGYHLKMMMKDSVQSFALGRLAIEKLVKCSDRRSTGGPMGTFNKTAWDCGSRKDCCVIANGQYTFEPSTKEGSKFGEGIYHVKFDNGDGFAGGEITFSSRFMNTIGPKWEGLYGLTPISCSGMDEAKMPKKCPGQKVMEQTRLL